MTLQSVGITGSRDGISDTQRRALTTFLHRARSAGATRFHHGCCVGADETGAGIAKNLGYWVIGHPSVKTEWLSVRARDELSSELREPRAYLTRDRNIVNEIGALIGLPNRPEVQRGSGTWYTVQYAREMIRARLVMLPDGEVVDRVGVDEFYPVVHGEFAARGATTDHRIEGSA